MNHLIPKNGETVGSISSRITAMLGGSASNITFGDLVLNPKDQISYPKWVDFSITVGGLAWNVKVWLVDTAFAAEYPFGEFTVVYLNR